MLTPRNHPVQAGQPGHRRKAAALIAAAFLAYGAVMGAHADDRPFLRTTHALPNEDADGWEVSVMAVANRRGQALSTQIERDLSPTQKLEFEFGRSPHPLGPEPEQGLRLRSLWRSPAESDGGSGWGFATKLGIEPRRSGEDGGQRQQAQGVWSWAATPHSWLHLNLGWQWRREDEQAQRLRTSTRSLALHTPINGQHSLYLEAAGSGDGRDRLLHLGVRHWLAPQRLALDTGLGQQNGSERPGRFLAINLNFFDLD